MGKFFSCYFIIGFRFNFIDTTYCSGLIKIFCRYKLRTRFRLHAHKIFLGYHREIEKAEMYLFSWVGLRMFHNLHQWTEEQNLHELNFKIFDDSSISIAFRKHKTEIFQKTDAVNAETFNYKEILHVNYCM